MPTPAAVMQVIVTANTAGANSALAATDKQMKKTAATSQTLSNRVSTAGKASVASLAAIGVVSGKVAIDFDKNMRNVNSIAQMSEQKLASMSEEVRNLAGKTAQSPQTLAQGLYDLVSSGFKADEAMGVLEKSATAATAGLTTTEVATKAVAASLNAYRLPASKAGDVSDILFRTVDRGVISFETLAGSIGMALPAAAALDIPLQDLGASIATLTKEGQSGESAVVNINAAMTALFKPTKAMSAAIDELGYKNSEALIAAEGFQGGLMSLIGTTDGTTKSVGELFANVRAQRAVFGLTGKNAEGAAQDLRGLQAAAGATDKALSQQSQSVAYMWNKLKAQAEDLAIGVGNNLIPAMKEVLDIISDPKLDTDQKVDMVLSKVVDTVESYGPEVAETGGKLAIALGKGFVHSFYEADPLGKLFLAASVVRMVGGPGVLGKAGAALAAPVWAAFTASTAGTAVGVAGLNIADGLASSLKYAIPGAIAAYGIYDVVADAISGQDSTDKTIARAGLAAAGGFAGGLAFGLPGALAGAGIGAIIGGFLDDIPMPTYGAKDLAKRIKEQAKEATKSLDGLGENYQDATDKLRKAKERDATASDEARQAERQLERIRKRYPANSRAVAKAELKVAEAKKESKRASDALARADRKQGAERDLIKMKLTDALGPQKANINQLRKEERQLFQTYKAMNKGNSSLDERIAAGEEWQEKSGELKDAQRELTKTYAKADKLIGPQFTKKLKGMSKELGEQARRAAKAEQRYDKLNDAINSPVIAGKGGGGAGSAAWAMKQLREKVDDAADAADQAQFRYERLVNRGLEPTRKKTKDLADESGKTTKTGKDQFRSWGDTLGEILNRTETNLNKALSAMGVKDKVDFSASGGTPSGGGGKKPGKHAQGATIVPGIQGGDRHTLSLNGTPIAHVESGEKIAVVNREAAKYEMALNNSIGRYAKGGMVGGTVVEALGPYSIPPFQYDANHAGGNSHWHIAMSTIPAVIAVGKQLQAMGFSVGENPAFGGVQAQHAAGGYHYTGQAIDVNSAADETEAETRRVAALLNGGRFKGAATVAAQQLSDIAFSGPNGLLTNIGQGVGDQLIAAANKYLEAHAPAMGGSDYTSVEAGGPVVTQMGKILLGNGFSRAGAAGIIGNAYRESLWDPSSVGTGGGGLFGFTTSPISLADLQAYAQKRGKRWTDVGLQMEFMLNGPGGLMSQDYYSVLESFLKSTDSVHDATYRFMDEWERPGIPAFEDRLAGAQKAFADKSWARGGMLPGFATGGLLNLKDAMRKTEKAVDPEKGNGPNAAEQRKRIAKHLQNKIEKLSEMGGKNALWSPDGSELGGALKKAREQVDMYSEFAGNASALSDDGIVGTFQAGREGDIAGQVNGSEAYWLIKQLDALKELRNRALRAEREAAKQQERVAKALERAKDRMKNWMKEVSKAQRQLDKEGKLPSDWKKGDPDPVDGEVKKWNELKDKKRMELYKKFQNKGGRLPGDRMFAEDGSILTSSSHPDKFPNVSGMQAVVGLLKNTVVPGLATEKSQLHTAVQTLNSELESVQGLGGNRRHYKKLPPIGTLGGEIFQAQDALRANAAASAGSGAESDALRAEILAGMLQESNLRTAVSQAQYDVFAQTPVLGAFEKGGTAGKTGQYLVGEKRPEVVTLPAGARVAPDTSEVGGDLSVAVLVHGDIVSDRRDPVEVLINDKRFKAAVQTVTKGQARQGGRPLPGRGGS